MTLFFKKNWVVIFLLYNFLSNLGDFCFCLYIFCCFCCFETEILCLSMVVLKLVLEKAGIKPPEDCLPLPPKSGEQGRVSPQPGCICISRHKSSNRFVKIFFLLYSLPPYANDDVRSFLVSCGPSS